MSSFFSGLEVFCTELSPVVGPLVRVIGETAGAIDRASRSPRLRGDVTPENAFLLSPEDAE